MTSRRNSKSSDLKVNKIKSLRVKISPSHFKVLQSIHSSTCVTEYVYKPSPFQYHKTRLHLKQDNWCDVLIGGCAITTWMLICMRLRSSLNPDRISSAIEGKRFDLLSRFDNLTIDSLMECVLTVNICYDFNISRVWWIEIPNEWIELRIHNPHTKLIIQLDQLRTKPFYTSTT